MSRPSTTVSNPGSRRGSSSRQASAHGFRPRFEKYETKKEKAERERAEDEDCPGQLARGAKRTKRNPAKRAKRLDRMKKR